MKHRYTWHAWAIKAWKSPMPGAHPYVGPSELPYGTLCAFSRGFPVAAFRTRRDAREALSKLRKKGPFYKDARIVRVEINATFDEGSAT